MRSEVPAKTNSIEMEYIFKSGRGPVLSDGAFWVVAIDSYEIPYSSAMEKYRL